MSEQRSDKASGDNKLPTWPRIGVDVRVAGQPEFYLAMPDDPPMKIPPSYRNSVAFLQCKALSGLRLGGTAFFVQLREGKVSFPYLVTARHVIDGIRRESTDGSAYVRVNSRDGQAVVIRSGIDQWYAHPTDPAADVAVLPWAASGSLDVGPWEMASIVTPEVAAEEMIGIGDEVHVLGLFTKHSGKEKNLPILRTGNIAAMPDEPVQTPSGLMEAYLIEARSIGGLSGSPVFIVQTASKSPMSFAMRVPSENPSIFSSTCRSIRLLGLMHGHWSTDSLLLSEYEPDAAGQTRLNTGIAVVVPAPRIMETLAREELAEQRRAEIQRVTAANATDPDA